MNYRGHGDRKCWQSSIGLSCNDVNSDVVQPGNDVAHILSIACNTAALQEFPDVCFGAMWLRTDKAISFLGASSPSYTLQNDSFDKLLWEHISNDTNVKNIGDAYFIATVHLLTNSQSASVRHNVTTFLMLGDGAAACA